MYLQWLPYLQYLRYFALPRYKVFLQYVNGLEVLFILQEFAVWKRLLSRDISPIDPTVTVGE